MKITDFAPRTAPFDHFAAERFAGKTGLRFAELGVDAGAHAESMLKNTPGISTLYLIDPWEGNNLYQRGICTGRLDATGGHGRFIQVSATFQAWAVSGWAQNTHGTFDGIYCDLPQDGLTARDAVKLIWPMVKSGGLFGYRNYAVVHKDMKDVLDSFLVTNNLPHAVEMAELIVFKP